MVPLSSHSPELAWLLRQWGVAASVTEQLHGRAVLISGLMGVRREGEDGRLKTVGIFFLQEQCKSYRSFYIKKILKKFGRFESKQFLSFYLWSYSEGKMRSSRTTNGAQPPIGSLHQLSRNWNLRSHLLR